jgi:hypothetical protein
MGTNFYYITPISESEQQELKDMITSKIDFCDLRDKIDIVKKCHYVHLGKRSYGWQFLWDYHEGKFFKDNLQSIQEYLKNGGGEIQDECGEKITIDDFFNDEIKSCLYKDDTHDTLESYYAKDPTRNKWGVRPSREEFISKDGLRFSKNEDFC